MYEKKNIINDLVYPELSYKIIGICFSVFNDLGYGYKEKFYEKAIAKSLYDLKIIFKTQVLYYIKSKNGIVARQYLDILIDNKIILEIKVGDYFSKNNIQQTNSYLKVTGLKLALLVNFTPHGVKFKRLVNIK